MARTNTLSNFLTDIATAIKQKKDDQTDIQASEFDTEILALPAQGTYQTKSITITTNTTQTVFPDTGYDAIDELTITTQIPQNRLQIKSISITSNGNITVLPDNDYDAMERVNLTVDVTNGDPIYQTTSVEIDVNRTIDYIRENTISFYKDYTFCVYTFASGLNQGQFRIYNKDTLEASGTYSDWISTTNVTNGKFIVLGANSDESRIYLGMPYRWYRS